MSDSSKRLPFIFLMLSILLLQAFRVKRIMNKKDVYSTALRLLAGSGLGTLSQITLASRLSEQANHETGHFASDVYRENHNLFGMKANSRNYDTGVNRGHATYKNDIDSIKDMIQYLSERSGSLNSFVLSTQAYATRLKSLNYFEDSLQNYIKGMNG